ncbi:hypothetical protein lbkm_3730 [Lachnospiraceae bacterium KM106-2]|nr:hypothetical protein lbkm_3730 [Lachnospiraceae bacterium KM106-2]
MKAYIRTAIFLILVFGVAVFTIVKPQKKFSSNENRYLQQRPSFSLTSFQEGNFSKEYESYVTDQFPYRDQWIELKVNIERMMQRKDVNGVYFGKDNYLIAKHSEKDFEPELINKNINRLNKFIKNSSDMLKNPINVMLVPTSSQVLVDKLPMFAAPYDQDRLMEQMKQSLQGEKVSFLDMTETLKQHQKEYIYYRTDHHWTTLGAYYSYCEWAKRNGFNPVSDKDYKIQKATDEFFGTTYSKVNVPVKADSIKLYEFPALKCEVKINDGEKKKDSLYDKEYLEQKDKYATFLGGNHAYVTIDTNVKNGRTLLVIKDSFAHSFIPFAANHYEKIVMIDYRYFNGSTKKVMEDQKVTDVLVLYNTVNFAQDKYFGKILK